MWIIAVHGGAGTWNVSLKKAYKIAHVIKDSLIAGGSILSSEGSALDAVEAAVRVMEASGVLNAGLGSCLNIAGEVEMDAAIMDGDTLKGGAVACIKNIIHPVSAARKVMEFTDHILLSGEYATYFALKMNIEYAKNLINQSKIRQYKKLLKELKGRESKNMKVYEIMNLNTSKTFSSTIINNDGNTVGAVALDSKGKLAAATSTGGMWLKLPGRIGDTPLLGAGTYANKYAAVSATGVGEHIIRVGMALRICDMVEKGIPLQQAVKDVMNRITQLAGKNTAGVIAVDRYGNYVFDYNTPGMARGVLIENKKPEVMVWNTKINIK
ncbi:MAG: isoaspartyl peptidase/L-asparaginase family protein [Thermoprotei archaeon]|mgnify:CR=1 FL=1|jgi:beta-aspartyl-peptidase (threonine type)